MKVKPCNCVGLTAIVAVLVGTGVAHAQGIDTNSNSLPPAGVYRTPAQVHADYPVGPGLDVVLSQVQHQPFVGTATHTPINGGLDDLETFGSQVSGMVSVNNTTPFSVSGTGPVSVIVSNYTPGATGTFNTEMIQLDLNLGGGVEVRESPTLPSLGQTTITPIGGGNFHIDSFFDVFTELSLDGGATWTPSDGSAHVNLAPYPEPSTVALFGIGLCGLLGCAWRRRRSASSKLTCRDG